MSRDHYRKRNPMFKNQSRRGFPRFNGIESLLSSNPFLWETRLLRNFEAGRHRETEHEPITGEHLCLACATTFAIS